MLRPSVFAGATDCRAFGTPYQPVGGSARQECQGRPEINSAGSRSGFVEEAGETIASEAIMSFFAPAEAYIRHAPSFGAIKRRASSWNMQVSEPAAMFWKLP